jgi:RNA polymerase sigma factor (sigma-70 family)
MECEKVSGTLSRKYEDMTNEELVFLIQEENDNQEAWATLWEKTEETIYYVYHKKVNRYYKDTMNDDILAILKVGWHKAVISYKKEKATAGFHVFATFIIDQTYRQFLRKITPEKVGKSIRCDFIQDIKLNTRSLDSPSSSVDFSVINLLRDERAEDDFERIEQIEYVRDKMEVLKKELPDSYTYITEVIWNGLNYRLISEKYNVSHAHVSRSVKKGYEFLYDQCYFDRLNNII